MEPLYKDYVLQRRADRKSYRDMGKIFSLSLFFWGGKPMGYGQEIVPCPPPFLVPCCNKLPEYGQESFLFFFSSLQSSYPGEKFSKVSRQCDWSTNMPTYGQEFSKTYPHLGTEFSKDMGKKFSKSVDCATGA